MSEPSVVGEGRPGGRPEPPQPEVWDGVLLFGADGRLVAATAGLFEAGTRPVRDVGELEARYRQSDGMAIDLWRRGRHVGIPIEGDGPRVLLASEPLTGADGTTSALTVAIDAFRNEDDPQTVQRALGSVLAHELRTPMTTVYGGAELLANPRLPAATRNEAARSVARAVEQLHRVIEDLVVLVRWPREPMDDAEPVLLQPILRAAVRRAAAGDVAIELVVASSVPPVAGAPSVIEQIVRNLVEHSIANSPPGGRVVVEARDNGEWVVVSVSDDGPALTSEERSRAFELFAPTSRQAADPSGANLPLVAARRLVERLGGRLEAGRREHGGQLTVRLRAVRERQREVPL